MTRSRRLAAIKRPPIQDIPLRKPRQQRFAPPCEIAVNMSDTSSKGKGRLEEIKSEVSDQAQENKNEMSLEMYLDNLDRYRSTSLLNPWPYPLALQHAPHLQDQILPLQDDIHAILDLHGFPDNAEFLPFVATKPQYPGGHIPIKLLRVTLRAEDHMPTQLDAAKDHILQLLHASKIMDMHVEIVNIDLCAGPSIFPLSSQHPILTIFENVKDQIIQTLDHRLGSKWNVLCLFGVGRSEQNAHPAIVVHVDPITFANWSNLASEIKVTVSKHAEGHAIGVEFLPGDLFTLQSGEVSFTDRIDPNGLPVMGHSIGIVGEENVGTLGAYFTLAQNGKIHRGLLTNYHVVRPPALSADTEECLDRFGCSMLQPVGQAIQMESPATVDRDATILDIDQRLEVINQRMEDLSMKTEERKQIGARPLPTLQRTLEQCEVTVSDLHSKHKILQQMPYLMGNVAAASGKAILGKRLMDWAFVELSDTAAEMFFRPNVMFPVPPDQLPQLYDPDLRIPVPAGTPLTEIGGLEKDQYYLKLGRSTGVTAGICHGALACCNWKGKDRVRYQHDGQQVETSSDVTEEYVIVNKKRGETEHQQASFAEGGDSGSLVINIDGQVCGLLYGATSGLYGPPGRPHSYVNAGLAMDFAELSKSIKLRTMTKVSNGKIVTPPAELGIPEST